MKGSYICYIGRPSYQKNTFFLLDVVERVHKEIPELKFYLLGVGYYSPDLKKLEEDIERRKLSDTMILLPWLSHQETLEFLDKALLYVSVARYEGLPLSVIEAMSLSKVIIASNVIGNKDCVDDGYNGYLLNLNAPDAFAEKIEILAKDNEKRKLMERHSRESFERRFLIDNRIGEIENIYKSINQSHR